MTFTYGSLNALLTPAAVLALFALLAALVPPNRNRNPRKRRGKDHD